MNEIQIIEIQNTIIQLQSDAIKDLFVEIMKHIAAEEADRLPVVDKINAAASLKNEIEEDKK